MTIENTRKNFVATRNGGNIYLLVKTKELKYELEVDGATFNNLKIGERKKAFISKRIKSGFFTDKEKVSLLYCLYKDEKHKFILTIMGFLVIIFPLYSVGLQFTKEEVIKRYNVIEKKITQNSKFFKLIAVTKEFLPYSTIILCLYAFGILTIQAVFIVEESGEIITGLVLFLTTISLSFLPGLILRAKGYLAEKEFIKNIGLIIKVDLGIWTFVKTINFIRTNDLTAYKNIGTVATSFFKFLIDF